MLGEKHVKRSTLYSTEILIIIKFRRPIGAERIVPYNYTMINS